MNKSIRGFAPLAVCALWLLLASAAQPGPGDPTFSDANWSSINPSIPGADFRVDAAVVDGSGNLYIGGAFTVVGDVIANGVAKWDGSSWSALGSGLSAPGIFGSHVSALAVSGSDLYAGGWFSTAGGKVSPYIARAYLLPLPALSVLRSGSEVVVSWPSADTSDFTLDQAGTLAATARWVTNSASATDDGINKSVSVPGTDPAQFFRLRRP